MGRLFRILLEVKDKRALGVWNASIEGDKGSAERHYCGTPLRVSDEQWLGLVYPFASVIDTDLPKAPSSVHLLLRDNASWVEPQIGPNDSCFDGYPELSIQDCSTLAQPSRDRGTGLQYPAPHRFIRVVEPWFGQQFLDIAVAQGEAEIKPDRMLDDRAGSDAGGSRAEPCRHPIHTLVARELVSVTMRAGTLRGNRPPAKHWKYRQTP
jgi:hypothetical protein